MPLLPFFSLPSGLQEFETKVADFCSSLEALRSAEIVARKAFREKHVGNLPPVFIEVISLLLYLVDAYFVPYMLNTR